MTVELLVKLPPVVCISRQRRADVSNEGDLPSDEGVLKVNDGGEVIAVMAPALDIVFKRW
jgi:hypothetical protein